MQFYVKKPYSIFKSWILTIGIWNSVALWSHTFLTIGPISSFLPGIFCLLFAEYQLHPPTQLFLFLCVAEGRVWIVCTTHIPALNTNYLRTYHHLNPGGSEVGEEAAPSSTTSAGSRSREGADRRVCRCHQLPHALRHAAHSAIQVFHIWNFPQVFTYENTTRIR